jgi:hypothetical protein
MPNTTQSQIGIEVISSINASGREIQQNLFATDLYVYLEIAGKQLIYFPEKESQFIIDNAKNQLEKFDLSKQIIQFEQMKQMIGELFIQEKPLEQGRHLQITNSNSSIIRLNAEVDVTKFEKLKKTVYHSFETFQFKIQPISILLQPNEIISSLQSTITFAGKNQESSIKLMKIKLLNPPYLHDYYLKWKIIT